ncbi:hypothetical protein LX16_4248 [Stackebrandtia albiflava]|uniref:Uncharacterized protein n=1 Tax=Stackebrandtia albiflava TaxID=406432 RepID=A0A562UYV5_9ACTN|nr:hypothetical protein [Stackebrandtia albiflava]TWJ10824.1 hypothetical protein LX16_4248 [Stackebrandtia albiflava]
MSGLDPIDDVLASVSGDGYIERLNGKISELMQKLRDGDGAISEEGSGGDPSQPYLSTDHLTEVLTDLVSVDPASFDAAITAYSAASLRLGADQLHDEAVEEVNPDTSAASRVTDYVQKALDTVAGDGTPGDPGWSGASATAFEENFAKFYVGPGQAVVNQRWMINSLQVTMEAHRAVHARARADVEELVDKALEAAGMGDDLSPGGTAEAFVTVVAAVVGVAAAGVGATTAWPIVAAATSGAASILGASEPEEPTKYDLSGEGAYWLFFDIQSAAESIKTARDGREDTIQSTVETLTEKFGQVRAKIVGPEVLDARGGSPIGYQGGEGGLDDDYVDGYHPPA